MLFCHNTDENDFKALVNDSMFGPFTSNSLRKCSDLLIYTYSTTANEGNKTFTVSLDLPTIGFPTGIELKLNYSATIIKIVGKEN